MGEDYGPSCGTNNRDPNHSGLETRGRRGRVDLEIIPNKLIVGSSLGRDVFWARFSMNKEVGFGTQFKLYKLELLGN